MKDYLLIGTYTTKDASGCMVQAECGRGVYSYEYQAITGTIGRCLDTLTMVNPSYFTADRTGKKLFVINEAVENGVVYLCGQKAGKLWVEDSLLMDGSMSCHVSYEEGKRLLAVSNYMSGSIGIAAERGEQKLEWKFQENYRGTGVDPVRQEMSHVHSSLFFKDQILVADLGLDQIHVYQVLEGQIIWKEDIHVKEGSGPRHMAVYENRGNTWLYVVNELSCDLSVCQWNGETYLEIQREPLYVRTCLEGCLAADVHITENGILYASVRGENRILWFGIHEDSGRLSLLGSMDSGGQGPRSFCFDREEKHLIVANQQSSNLAIFPMECGVVAEQEATRFSVPMPVKVLQITE